MASSHKATLRQYRLPSLGGMQSARNVVVIGHGMVGHRFVEALRARDAEGAWRVTVLAEEADAAYDRVGLTGYTEHWDRGQLALSGNDYRGDDLVELRLGSRVAEIDPPAKCVLTADGQRIDYDALVLATGSYAFVPPVPGHELPACHVYRTLDDLDAIRADARRSLNSGNAPVGVVIGGGLSAWKPPTLCALLHRMIAELGISVYVDVGTDSIETVQHAHGTTSMRVRLSDGTLIEAGLVIFAAGVRPATNWPARLAWRLPSAAECSPICHVPQGIPTSTRLARWQPSRAAATGWRDRATPVPKSLPTG